MQRGWRRGCSHERNGIHPAVRQAAGNEKKEVIDMVKVYGCSDDLVEIEGGAGGDEEIDCYDKDVRLSFDDGTVIRVHYAGEWEIKVSKKGTATQTLTKCETLKAQNPDAYSDIFEIDAQVVKRRKV